jgi:hypothetical protein
MAQQQYVALTKGNRDDLMIEILRGDNRKQVEKNASSALGVFSDDPRYESFKSNLIVMTVYQALSLGFI